MKMEEDKNILSMPSVPMPELKALGSTFFEKMQQYKNNIAQTDAVTGEKQTYSLVLQKSIRAAIAMRRKEIKPKDIITICSNNHLDTLIPFYGSLFLGALSANLDPATPLSDCVHLLKQVRPKLIFTIPEAVQLMEDTLKNAEIAADIVVFGHTSNHMEFSEFLIPFPEEEEKFHPYEVEDLSETAAILFSSGTTGLPKGICLTHYGLLGYTYNGSLSPPGTTTILVYANLYWVSSLSFTVHIVLHGLNRVICPKFQADSIWHVIKENKVNMFIVHPHQMVQICESGRPEEADTSSLQFAICGGSPVSEELVKQARSCLPGTLVVVAYGQTEVNGPMMYFRPDDLNDERLSKEKLTSVGRPQPGYSFKVVDFETEQILGPNQEGELWIKTEFAMNGYYNANSSYVWDSDGFLKTGDVVYYDNDHCFFIVNRVKDLLKYRMWHIPPVKLEAIFQTHPAVKRAAVTGKPHPVDGDHLMGLVELKESAVGSVNAEELQKYVDDQVEERYKLRAGVKIVQSLSVTITDKLNRWKIKQLVLQGKM